MNKIPQFNPTFTSEDIKSVVDYMNSGSFITEFKQSRKFEELLAEYSNTKYAVLFPNGTLTMYGIIKCLGLSKDATVVVPNFTMAATAFAPMEAGQSIKFVDVEYPSLTINTKILKNALEEDPNIKVVMYVAANGREPEEGINKIVQFCREKKLILIEDAAQGIGSTYSDGSKLGSISYASSISFSMPKIITTGQGGVVLTNEKDFYEKLVKYRDFGRLKSGNDIHNSIGLNFKFTDLQAVLGISQLSQIDKRVQRKKEIYLKYFHSIKSKYINLIPNLSTVAPWFIEIETEFREKLIEFLSLNGIGSRTMYPPLNAQEAFIRHPQYKKSLPISESIGKNGLWIPSSYHLTNDQIEYISNKINEFSI